MSKESDAIEVESRKILTAAYTTVESQSIPHPQDVPYGPQLKKFKASVFSIDIRNSSSYLSEGDTKSGKIHKAFLRICAQTVHNFGGEIRTFNGDGLLVFWEANLKSELTNPVRAAMGIKWMVTEKMKDLFIDKHHFNFGIGLSWGEVSAFRAGIQYVEGGNDLIFLDRSINEAVVIAKQAGAPYHVECTTTFYDNLEKEGRFADGRAMWKDGLVRWKNGDFKTKISDFYWSF